ncbi:rhomboid family intramembrane serine protease [Steroidobacter agaridevorans]|uniref:Rhomboid family intramembrane serine protease n=1 Tax=Steroidobacter agaridevorans TaxID=2695856 RepID=A0A829Y7Z9_9GAMM|nr:rhomboid family intramembrane serine protease [Steroidobacter agaridevorans]GFE79397.1 rhomboid family intramembrane serine protease [Steroidobacter agaridevorans]GFE88402.1 rhomboid family intramembrane serine protease [Steroidobacter agaridevorans]
MPTITPLNRALILINVVVFVLQSLTGGPEASMINALFGLWPPQAGQFGYPEFHVWQLLTYGFLHGGWAHLFFNMFALFMFGSDIERLFGSRRYLFYYLACVVGAALMHLIVTAGGGGVPAQVVGASGGVFGLLLAYGMAFPKRTLMLMFPPIPMPAWLFVTLYGIFELVMGVTQTASGVAHFAHLGGMATGFVIIRYWRARARARR